MIDKMKIKGAIFDMDGTLVDSLCFWEYYWQNLGKKFKGVDDFKPSSDDDRKCRTMLLKDVVKVIKEGYGFTQSEDELFRFSTDFLRQFYQEIVKEKQGATKLLESLKQKGVKICLATATDMGNVKVAIKATGLEHFFDVVLSCGDIGKGKDQPDIYLKAIEELGVSPEEACVFEDSFVAIETAKSIGVKTVGIYDKYNYGQDRLKASSDVYLEDGNLEKLISIIEKG